MITPRSDLARPAPDAARLPEARIAPAAFTAARTTAVAVMLLALGACGGGSGDAEPDAGPVVRDEGLAPGPGVGGPGETGDSGTTVVPFGSGTPTVDADGPATVDEVPPVDAELPRSDVRDVDELRPYVPDSPWSDVLAGCALADETDDACALETLPFIAQATESPGVAEIMERVLVTHDWMGMRFEAMLRRAPDGLLPLFAPTTSIAIGSTVRPSFYTGLTGGVRLDPEYLWQTVAEKATISIDDDPRGAFGVLLGFRDLFASRIGDEAAFEFFSLKDRSERTFEQAQKPLLSLLFHELAHANDFLPPGTAGFMDSSMRPFEALDANREQWLSPRLQAQYPQNSTRLMRLADVRFRGEDPTEEETAITADDIGAEFAGDGAHDFYAYSTIREDFAELFEGALMKAVFDIDTHVAFTNQPADLEDFSCDDLIVGWGARKRLGDPAVALRAGWAVAAIYGPGDAVDGFVAAQTGTEELMTPGVDFCTNLVGGTTLAARGRAGGDRALPTPVPWEPMSDAERHALVARGSRR